MGAASRKGSPTPTQTLLASIALMRRSLRLSSLASQLPSFLPARSLARSLAGPARAVRRAPAPVPAPARSQSVFHANPRAASFPSAVTAPLPPGLPASSSPGRPARPQPPGGRPISPARRGARPRGRSGTAAALAGARRTRRGPDLRPAGVWRKSWERSCERGPPPARNPHSGSSIGVAGPSGLDSRRMAVQPKAGGAPLGGPWSERGRLESRGPGSWGARLDARALMPVRGLGRPWRPESCFYSFNFEITLAESPETMCERGSWEVEELCSRKWTFGDLSDSLDNSWSWGVPCELSARWKISLEDIS